MKTFLIAFFAAVAWMLYAQNAVLQRDLLQANRTIAEVERLYSLAQEEMAGVVQYEQEREVERAASHAKRREAVRSAPASDDAQVAPVLKNALESLPE